MRPLVCFLIDWFIHSFNKHVQTPSMALALCQHPGAPEMNTLLVLMKLMFRSGGKGHSVKNKKYEVISDGRRGTLDWVVRDL